MGKSSHRISPEVKAEINRKVKEDLTAGDKRALKRRFLEFIAVPHAQKVCRKLRDNGANPTSAPF